MRGSQTAAPFAFAGTQAKVVFRFKTPAAGFHWLPTFRTCATCLWLSASALTAEALTRSQTLEIAAALASHCWTANEQNIRHGCDLNGIEVHTPNGRAGEVDLWTIGTTNVGIPYKWGGFDSIESFERGIRAGKAAGDLYSTEKRRQGGAAVSSHAVGLDCSGFISRCWRLSEKHSTSSLPALCVKLQNPAELRAGDIMNQPGGHVLLFARWLGNTRQHALFYEAHPFSKVRATQRALADLRDAGFSPLRYRHIRD